LLRAVIARINLLERTLLVRIEQAHSTEEGCGQACQNSPGGRLNPELPISAEQSVVLRPHGRRRDLAM
jgi:hypothetical protein